MSRNNGRIPKMDLNLSLPTRRMGDPPRRAENDDRRLSSSSSSSSSPGSCVSSEAEQGSNSQEATSMVLAACPRCLMYVMLAEEDPKCPKCHNPVLLDFLHGNNTTKNTRKT